MATSRVARCMSQIRPITHTDRTWIAEFIKEQWGAEIVVAHVVIYHPHMLPGFVATCDDEINGLVTYDIQRDSCEIVTLNSLQPGNGMGTALIDAVKRCAEQSNCRRLWLITVNNNLPITVNCNGCANQKPHPRLFRELGMLHAARR